MKTKKKSYYTHARTDLLRLIPKNARIFLDVGCGEGILGKQIKKLDKKTEVIGIEKDEMACKIAAEHLDSVISGDIEKITLPFKENYFDCIIAGDVLEHLVSPWETLERLRCFLKEEGFFIASIPNIRYYKALIRLFLGYWDYTDAGIFDRSHLRFFTLINIKEMFQNAGFRIAAIRRNMVSARGFRIMNRLLFNQLKDFLTYQFYIVARKAPYTTLPQPTRRIHQF